MAIRIRTAGIVLKPGPALGEKTWQFIAAITDPLQDAKAAWNQTCMNDFATGTDIMGKIRFVMASRTRGKDATVKHVCSFHTPEK